MSIGTIQTITWGMIHTIDLLILLFSAVSAWSGVLVICGSLRMRELKNYRLCRVSAIVAILPTGPDVVFGVPFGLWALLILRRPDVKAAFAVNESS